MPDQNDPGLAALFGEILRPGPRPIPTLREAGDLAAACQPFAKLFQHHHAEEAPETGVFRINDALVTVGDLRRLIAALAPFGGVK